MADEERIALWAGLAVALLTLWQKTKEFRARVWWLLTRPWKLTEGYDDLRRDREEEKRWRKGIDRKVDYLIEKDGEWGDEVRKRLNRDESDGGLE